MEVDHDCHVSCFGSKAHPTNSIPVCSPLVRLWMIVYLNFRTLKRGLTLIWNKKKCSKLEIKLSVCVGPLKSKLACVWPPQNLCRQLRVSSFFKAKSEWHGWLLSILVWPGRTVYYQPGLLKELKSWEIQVRCSTSAIIRNLIWGGILQNKRKSPPDVRIKNTRGTGCVPKQQTMFPNFKKFPQVHRE